jgi:citrate lyase subunit beta/citryl-CoA lyase
MRSLLFVPGNSAKMMAKAALSGADVLILDLEDAVHPDAKRPAAPRATSGSMRSTARGARPISKLLFRRVQTASCCRN